MRNTTNSHSRLYYVHPARGNTKNGQDYDGTRDRGARKWDLTAKTGRLTNPGRLQLSERSVDYWCAMAPRKRHYLQCAVLSVQRHDDRNNRADVTRVFSRSVQPVELIRCAQGVSSSCTRRHKTRRHKTTGRSLYTVCQKDAKYFTVYRRFGAYKAWRDL